MLRPYNRKIALTLFEQLIKKLIYLRGRTS